MDIQCLSLNFEYKQGFLVQEINLFRLSLNTANTAVMKSNTDIRGRRSIRLKEFDYSQPGAYFITVCTNGRQCMFGDIVDEEMILNDAGAIVRKVWEEIPRRFSAAKLGEFVIMPNHLHGIIVIVGAVLAPPTEGAASSAPTLAEIIRAFKSLSGRQVNRLLSRKGKSLWQRNYYEHVIRNETELDRVRRYIVENPIKWDIDPENPHVGATGGSPVLEEP